MAAKVQGVKQRMVNMGPERGGGAHCYVFRNPITHTIPAIEYSLIRVHHHYACAIIYIASSLLSTL